VLPFEQWLPVFANNAFIDWPGLRSKAFTVWFPTMIDFEKGVNERQALRREAKKRNVDCRKIFRLADELTEQFKKVLSLFSRDEQFFIRDRRHQNLHGRLHIYIWDNQNIDWFDKTTGSIKKCSITADEYRKIMALFYSDMQKNTLALLNRLLNSNEFKELLELYENKLVFQTKLAPLANELGIIAKDNG